MRQQSDLNWLELGTGAFCCVVAGWLAAAAWSRYYWSRSMLRQVVIWRRLTDAFFSWLEDAPVPPDALRNLESSIEQVVPSPSRR